MMAMRNIQSSLVSNVLKHSQPFNHLKLNMTASLSTSTSRPVQFYQSAIEAIHDIQDGAKILVGGYGLSGLPSHLLNALVEKRVSSLTYVGMEMSPALHLTKENQIKRIISAHMGLNLEMIPRFLRGELEVEFIPQGTLVEMLRAGGSGISAFYTPTGHGTLVHKGGIPIKTDGHGQVVIESKPRQERKIGGVNCILAESMVGDFALVKAWKADTSGNLVFRKAARNGNPVMCKAGQIAIAEAEEIVEAGSISPEDVHIPHAYVDRIIHGPKNRQSSLATDIARNRLKLIDRSKQDMKDKIARRAALELEDGMNISLGYGLPALTARHISPDIQVFVHTDGGCLGIGPPAVSGEGDLDLINPNGEMVTCITGGSFFAAEEVFTMSRGGHLDLVLLGAMEVSQYGDLANWIIPGKMMQGMGGAMDLVAHENTKVIITMEHTSKNGKPKILQDCTLPLTAKGCVNKVITEMGVFETTRDNGLVMTEIADGFSTEDVRKATGCELKVSPDLRPMQTESSRTPSDITTEQTTTMGKRQ